MVEGRESREGETCFGLKGRIAEGSGSENRRPCLQVIT